jgi:alkylated DNA repair dioxygenase AlkB
MQVSLRSSEAIQSFLLTLRERAANFAGTPPDGLQQIFINEYAPGAGIGWHRDKPMLEEVVRISFGASCTLRLRRKHGSEWERASSDVRPRTAYHLRGASRLEWEQMVP